MQPRRPDSAKTQLTKQTLDSEHSKRDLNSSKFSETFSSGVNSFHEKADEFKQYVAEKDKDPKFKHLKSKLDVIQEKSSKPEESKPSDKPFLRKKEKTIEKTGKKVQQKQQKPEEQLNLSRGFAQKSKIKMNSLKMSSQQKQKEEEKANEKLKSKINFDSFKIRKPGEKKQSKKQQITVELKKQSSKQTQEGQTDEKKQINGRKEKNKAQIERENELRNLEMYVSEMQARNIEVFPRSYDRMVNASPGNFEDLQKIDINNFLDDPTEGDLDLLRLNVQQFDRQIKTDKQEEQSIDLQEIIGDDKSENDIEKQEDEQNQSYLSSMTASDLKKRNAFLTEVLAGKISKKQIDQLDEMNRSAMRMHKINHEKEEQDEVQFQQINMMKRKSNRLMERNRLEAGGQLYRDCDYLSEEQKKRLEELIDGQFGASPFQFDQLERIRRRNIDEGIHMYREMNESEQIGQIFDEESLPKDPELRRQAQKKILRQKIKSVNERLGGVDKITVTKAKIGSLIKRFQNTKRSSSFNQLCQQNKNKYQQNMKKLEEAESILKNLQQKQNINEIIQDIDEQYRQLEKEIIRWSEIDEKELKRMEKERLQRKLREVEELDKQNEKLNLQIGQMERIKEEIEEKLKIYDEIGTIELDNNIECEGYNKDQTLEDIDAVVTAKWQMSQKEPSETDTES